MLRIVILGLCFCFASAGYPIITSCLNNGTETAKVTNVNMSVSDCANPERCILIRNTTHTITMTFKSTQTTDGLKMYVYGRVLRVRVPYVRNVDLCSTTTASDGTTCTDNTGLQNEKTYTLTYPFYIRSQFPEWKVPVEFELWDSTGKLECIRMHVEIKCNVNTEATCHWPPAESTE